MEDLVGAVVRDGNCTGCGLCAALFPGDVRMDLDADGFLRPVVTPGAPPPARADVEDFRAACPGLHQDLRTPRGVRDDPVLGPHLAAFVGWARDPGTRHAGSSGGVITALSSWMLEERLVERVACAAASGADPARTVPVTLSDPREVLATAGSRYAPVGVAGELAGIGAGDVLVGKPCEVSAARHLQRRREDEDARTVPRPDAGPGSGPSPVSGPVSGPETGTHPTAGPGPVAGLRPAVPDGSGPLAPSGPVLISFFCAGTPSQSATVRLLEQGGVDPAAVSELRYRGQGWPGTFHARDRAGAETTLDYEESWGGTLGRTLQSACKTCPDGLGLFADIAVGDFWASDAQGFPVFEDAAGRSVVIARTPRGLDLLERAEKAGVLELVPQSLEDGAVARTQPFQVRRRRMLGPRRWGKRLAGARVPHLRGMVHWGWALRHPRVSLREARGTAQRVRAGRVRAMRRSGETPPASASPAAIPPTTPPPDRTPPTH